MKHPPIQSLNAAGAALKALGIGAVRLRYRPADHLVQRDTFAVWIDAADNAPDIIGTGDTPEEAYFDALAKRDGTRKAA